jgi:TM2 domain-containing membrane protein YozV
MKKIGYLFLLFFVLGNTQNAWTQFEQKEPLHLTKLLSLNKRNVDLSNQTRTHKKWVALGLNVSLGLFGVHRLYLGTSPKVPVIYTFTLGGGGVIFIGDLGALIFTKDIEKFAEKPEVIMW